MFCHLHITWFCTHKAKPSTQPHLAYRKSSPWSYSLPPVDGKHSKEGQPCRCSIPILAKSCKLRSLKYNSTGLRPLDLHGYKLTEDKQKWHHPVVHLLHISLKCLGAIFPWPCMAYPPSRALQDTTSHLVMSSCWTLCKHRPYSHIWHTCQLSYSPKTRWTHNLFQ
jgi:hypothetical protein